MWAVRVETAVRCFVPCDQQLPLNNYLQAPTAPSPTLQVHITSSESRADFQNCHMDEVVAMVKFADAEPAVHLLDSRNQGMLIAFPWHISTRKVGFLKISLAAAYR